MTKEQFVSKKLYEQVVRENRELKRQLAKERKQAYREGYQKGMMANQAVYSEANW